MYEEGAARGVLGRINRLIYCAPVVLAKILHRGYGSSAVGQDTWRMDVCASCSASTGEKFGTTAAGAEAVLCDANCVNVQPDRTPCKSVWKSST